MTNFKTMHAFLFSSGSELLLKTFLFFIQILKMYFNHSLLKESDFPVYIDVMKLWNSFSPEKINLLAGLKKEEMYSEIILSGWSNDYQGMQLEINGKKHRKCFFFLILDGFVEHQHQETGKSEKPLETILFTEDLCFTEDALQYLPTDG